MKYPIAIHLGSEGKWTFDAERRRKEPTAWQACLTKAARYRPETVCYCQCQPGAELPLYVRAIRNTSDFTVCRHPHTGREHARKCDFFGGNADGGRGAYEPAVIRQDEENFSVLTELSLKSPKPKEVSPAPKEHQPTRVGGSGKKRDRATLLGFLHLLWTEADLIYWRPSLASSRKWFAVANDLRELAKHIHVGRIPLSDALVIIPDFTTGSKLVEQHRAQNFTSITKIKAKTHRVCVIGEVDAIRDNPKNETQAWVSLNNGQKFSTALKADRAAVAIWRRSYALAFKAMEEKGCRCIGLFYVDFNTQPYKGTYYGTIADAAFMPTNSRFIPYDSSYELQLANRLIAEERTFDKPLRFDADEFSKPDFRLLDAGEIPLEVFGMATPEYLARKQEKVATYDELYGRDGWWSWSPLEEPADKPLPPRR